MTADDEWAVFSHSTVSSPSAAQRLETYVKTYQDALDTIEDAKTMLDVAAAEIARFFPEQEGEHSKETPNYMVFVSRAESMSWDKAKLNEIFGEGAPLPKYVKRSLSIDKKQWDKMSPPEQELVKDALTRKLSSPKIKVTRKTT